MKERVVICGAGFAGLELSTRLSESLADLVDVTLIDHNDSFVFGFSKLDVMFGRKRLDETRHYYRDVVKEGVAFRQERVTSIDPDRRRVVTDAGTYDSDILVVALGADYDTAATPGLDDGGYEFYSLSGAERARDAIAAFGGGDVIVAILGPTFKCPPAPFETAFLIDAHLKERGLREGSSIQVISPLPSPIPVSEDTSRGILSALTERGISSTFGELVVSLDPGGSTATLRSGGTVPYDLFLAIPVHRAPAVVEASGMTVEGWVPVDQRNLRTRFEGVYAVGDVASAPVPRAGVFAENAAITVAADIGARLRGEDPPPPYEGKGSCYIEFGGGLVGKVEADFLSGPSPKAPLLGPSRAFAEEKKAFATTRHDRWFGP